MLTRKLIEAARKNPQRQVDHLSVFALGSTSVVLVSDIFSTKINLERSFDIRTFKN